MLPQPSDQYLRQALRFRRFRIIPTCSPSQIITMCNENISTAALPSVFDTPFHKSVDVVRDQELENLFTKHHQGDAAFLHVDGNTATIHIGPFTITFTFKKVGNDYDLHVEIHFKVGPINKLIYQFNIKLPINGKCVCKSFNIIGIVKATLCFCFKDGCIYLQYDLQSIVGKWKGEVKVVCL